MKGQKSMATYTIVFGDGQLADLAWYYLTYFSRRRISAFTVEPEYLSRDTLHQCPMVGFNSVQDLYPPSQHEMLVFVSYRQRNKLRERLYLAAKEKGYTLVTYIHPKICNYAEAIGDNCFIMEENTIQPFVKIGDNCIVWANNHIGHHTVIGDHNFIASEVCISGSVTIGDRCFFGVNSTVRDNITIGDDCIIGAGAYVDRDLEPGTVIVPPRSVILDKEVKRI